MFLYINVKQICAREGPHTFLPIGFKSGPEGDAFDNWSPSQCDL